MKGSVTDIPPTTEMGMGKTRQRLIVVSKTSQKTGLASGARTLNREEARHTREAVVPVCVVQSSGAFVVHSEASRSLAALRV